MSTEAVVVVGVGLTVTVCELEVLMEKLESPLYFAVMEWLATESAEEVNWAEPLEMETAPSAVDPSRKVIVPVGEPPKAA